MAGAEGGAEGGADGEAEAASACVGAGTAAGSDAFNGAGLRAAKTLAPAAPLPAPVPVVCREAEPKAERSRPRGLAGRDEEGRSAESVAATMGTAEAEPESAVNAIIEAGRKAAGASKEVAARRAGERLAGPAPA